MSNVPFLGQRQVSATPGSSSSGSRAGNSAFPGSSTALSGGEKEKGREWFSSIMESMKEPDRKKVSERDGTANTGLGQNTVAVEEKNHSLSERLLALQKGSASSGNPEQGAAVRNGNSTALDDSGKSQIGQADRLFARIKEYAEQLKSGISKEGETANDATEEKARATAPGMNPATKGKAEGASATDGRKNEQPDAGTKVKGEGQTTGASSNETNDRSSDTFANKGLQKQTAENEGESGSGNRTNTSTPNNLNGKDPGDAAGSAKGADTKNDSATESAGTQKIASGAAANGSASESSGIHNTATRASANGSATESSGIHNTATGASANGSASESSGTHKIATGAAMNGSGLVAGEETDKSGSATDRQNISVRDQVNGLAAGHKASGESALNGIMPGTGGSEGKHPERSQNERASADVLKAGVKQDEGTQHSLRFASMTREYAQRLERITKGMDSRTEAQRVSAESSKADDMYALSSDSKKSELMNNTGRLQAARYEAYIKAFTDRSSASDTIRIPVVVGENPGDTAQSRSFQAITPVSAAQFAESASMDDEEFEWRKYVVTDPGTAGDDGEEANESTVSTSRLALQPVSNSDLRREILPGLAKFVQTTQESDRARQGGWQNHRFVMDDGKSLNVSVKETDGVMQLKLGTSSSELARLLQQHQQEIREHLQKECDIEIDLQLDSRSMDEFAGHFGDSSSQQNGSSGNSPGGDRTEPVHVDEVIPKSVRLFGYNQMEWTA